MDQELDAAAKIMQVKRARDAIQPTSVTVPSPALPVYKPVPVASDGSSSASGAWIGRTF